MNIMGWLLMVITVLCWGVSPLLEKEALKRVGPLNGLFIRNLTIFLFFLFYFFCSGRLKEVANISGKEVILFAISGVLAGFLGMYTYFTLLKTAPVSKIVPLVSTYPLITAILGMCILNEEVSLARILGIVLIITGVFLVK
ncbi:MAG: hypothetical protein B6D55_02955 [Candidatus Omnitrophica bacterium 4484_70.2]|nr:MAG: hypothetical protein B6D55_02955 [Candidatus Omnitrophica bacterium 4484_70.2]